MGLIDWQLVRTSAADDEGLVAELVGLYLESYEKRLADLGAAIAAGDAKKVEKAAHAIKGGIALFGVKAATAAAQELELQGAAGQLGADATAQLSQLARSVRAAADELREFLTKRGAA